MISSACSGSVHAGTVGGVLWLRDLLRRSPWWAASALFHLVLLLMATVVTFAVKPSVKPNCVGFEILVPRPNAPLPPRVKSTESAVDRAIPRDPNQAWEPTNPLVFDLTAKPSDHFESDDNQTFHQRKGEGFDGKSFMGRNGNGLFSTRETLAKAGLSPALGIGGGAGGSKRFGGKLGGRENLIRPNGLDPKDVLGPVLDGLKWLARHQETDGRWSGASFDAACRGPERCSGTGAASHDVGITGLALLAFLGAGYTPSVRSAETIFQDPFTPGRTIRFDNAVKNGLRWLLDHQDGEGCFGPQSGEFMYDHSIAALALAEATWLCLTPLYREPAQRGIDFLVKAQNPGMAWRYSVRPGDNDTSVTGWCVMALKSAELSGLKFDRGAFDGARSWLQRVTNSQGVVGYESPGDKGSVIPGVNDRWESHPSMTAVGLLTRIFIDRKKEPWMKVAASQIVKDLPVWDPAHRTVDYYYWYYAALALHQFDAPNGPAWKAFHGAMEKALIPHQEREKSRCAQGSWDPSVDKWGSVGGRVYAAAINVLTLEVYYRYQNVFTGDRTALRKS